MRNIASATTVYLSSVLSLGVLCTIAIDARIADAAIYDCSVTPFIVNAATGNIVLSPGDIIRKTLAGTCVEMYDGRDLNLNGATIECAYTDDHCERAVEAYDPGSTIQNGAITGPFDVAVSDVALVKNVTFDGVGLGVDMAEFGRTVTGNVFRDTTEAVEVGFYATSSYYVHDNFLDTGYNGIVSSGSSGYGPRVEHNFIRNFSNIGIDTNGGESWGTRNMRITENVVANTPTPISLPLATTPTFTRNICDDAGICPQPTPPFVLP